MYQTRQRVFHHDIQTPRSALKTRGAAEFFSTDLRNVFAIPDIASQTIKNSWRNSSKSSQNFIKIRYSNNRHSSDNFVFSLWIINEFEKP